MSKIIKFRKILKNKITDIDKLHWALTRLLPKEFSKDLPNLTEEVTLKPTCFKDLVSFVQKRKTHYLDQFKKVVTQYFESQKLDPVTIIKDWRICISQHSCQTIELGYQCGNHHVKVPLDKYHLVQPTELKIMAEFLTGEDIHLSDKPEATHWASL